MPAPAAARRLSIFFPAYNDSGTIASLVITARQTAQKLTSDFEVIVVNDGSRDATPEIADELARTYPEVRVIHHPKNRGYGGALRSGIRERARRSSSSTPTATRSTTRPSSRLLWPADDRRASTW